MPCIRYAVPCFPCTPCSAQPSSSSSFVGSFYSFSFIFFLRLFRLFFRIYSRLVLIYFALRFFLYATPRPAAPCFDFFDQARFECICVCAFVCVCECVCSQSSRAREGSCSSGVFRFPFLLFFFNYFRFPTLPCILFPSPLVVQFLLVAHRQLSGVDIAMAFGNLHAKAVAAYNTSSLASPSSSLSLPLSSYSHRWGQQEMQQRMQTNKAGNKNTSKLFLFGLQRVFKFIFKFCNNLPKCLPGLSFCVCVCVCNFGFAAALLSAF